MSEAAIKIPFGIFLQKGESGTWAAPSWAEETHTPAGWLLPGTGIPKYTYSLVLPVEIPTNINPTPNAKVILLWTTTSDNITDNATMQVSLSTAAPNSGSLNPATFGETLSLFAAPSAGPGINNRVEIASTLGMAGGSALIGQIFRNPADGSDQLEENIILRQAILVADDTA